jgi:hypothetical protein
MKLLIIILILIVILIVILIFYLLKTNSSNNINKPDLDINKSALFIDDSVKKNKLEIALMKANFTGLNESFSNVNIVFNNFENILLNFEDFINTYFSFIDFIQINGMIKDYGSSNTIQQIMQLNSKNTMFYDKLNIILSIYPMYVYSAYLYRTTMYPDFKLDFYSDESKQELMDLYLIGYLLIYYLSNKESIKFKFNNNFLNINELRIYLITLNNDNKPFIKYPLNNIKNIITNTCSTNNVCYFISKDIWSNFKNLNSDTTIMNFFIDLENYMYINIIYNITDELVNINKVKLQQDLIKYQTNLKDFTFPY